MRKLILFLAISFFSYLPIIAQEKSKIKFHSITNIGIAWGATGEGFQAQTINGIRFKTFSTGLGVGLDYYWTRTIPLFLDIRKDIFNKAQTPFVYLDLGTHAPTVKANPEYKGEYGKGVSFDVGVGYKNPINKKLSLNVSFGYTQKRYSKTEYNHYIIIDFPPYDRDNSEHYDYIFRRFSMKAGLSF